MFTLTHTHMKCMSLWGEILSQMPRISLHLKHFANECNWHTVPVHWWSSVYLCLLPTRPQAFDRSQFRWVRTNFIQVDLSDIWVSFYCMFLPEWCILHCTLLHYNITTENELRNNNNKNNNNNLINGCLLFWEKKPTLLLLLLIILFIYLLTFLLIYLTFTILCAMCIKLTGPLVCWQKRLQFLKQNKTKQIKY